MIDAETLLRVADIRARYGLEDRRSARAVMEQAGAFLVAGRLVVRLDRLVAWERRSDEKRGAPLPAR